MMMAQGTRILAFQFDLGVQFQSNLPADTAHPTLVIVVVQAASLEGLLVLQVCAQYTQDKQAGLVQSTLCPEVCMLVP